MNPAIYKIRITEPNGDSYTLGIAYRTKAEATEDAEFHERTTDDIATVIGFDPTHTVPGYDRNASGDRSHEFAS